MSLIASGASQGASTNSISRSWGVSRRLASRYVSLVLSHPKAREVPHTTLLAYAPVAAPGSALISANQLGRFPPIGRVVGPGLSSAPSGRGFAPAVPMRFPARSVVVGKMGGP